MSTSREINEAAPPWNFSWVVKDKLAAFAWPQTVSNMEFLYEQGIRYVVTLSPEKRPPVRQFPHIKWTMISIEEFEAPTLEDIKEFISICEECHKTNEAVGIHCRMGRGRTGVMAACYMVKFLNIHPDSALTNLRMQRPGSVETSEQVRAVKCYYDFLRGTKT